MAEINANTETQEVVPETSLPSESNEESNPWDVSELIDENGLVAGKFKSIEAMIESAKKADEHISKLNGDNQRTKQQIENEAKAAETEANNKQVAAELIKKVVDSGMELSDELIEEANKIGMSPAELELSAIKTKQHVEKMTNIVGGEEVYQKMMEDMGQDMSESQKAQFTKDVNGNLGEYAVRGLHQAWLEKTGQQVANVERIEGRTSTGSSVKGYSDSKEMQMDLRYLQTAGRNDKAAWAKHEARKKATPDSVFYGR